MLKKNGGITLIALVVTIIVLLILAGVTIAMLTGDNGIITNSQNAKEQTSKQGAAEAITIALNSIKTEVLAQVNTKTTYEPIGSTERAALMDKSITGLSSATVVTEAPTVASTTGYYIMYADKKTGETVTGGEISIYYVDKEANFLVTGKITFDKTSYANGGDITRPTV